MTTSIRNILFLLIFGLFGLTGCKTPSYSNVDAGNIETYVPGLPNFNIGAIGLYNSNQIPAIHVFLNLPYSNLIFKANNGDGTYYAKFDITLGIKKTNGNKKQFQKSYTKEIVVSNYKETKSFAVYAFKASYITEPGKYLIEANVTDDNSKKAAYNRTTTYIPDLNDKSIATSAIQLEGKFPSFENRSNQFHPLVTYNIGEGMDSLKASMQMFLKNSNNDLKVTMYLLRFKSDTLPARPPQYLTPNPASLAYRGIDFRKADTLQKSFRNYSGITGSPEVDFTMPKLSEGNYRVQVLGKSPDPYLNFNKSRDFSIKGPAYPRLTTLKQLAEAVVYIAYPKEYKKLKESLDTDTLKSAFDSFWGRIIANKNLAKSVISSYYSRVEEANMLFSTYKAGWKTDPGMVYILYGPPSYVEKGPDGMAWYYSHSMDDISGSFYFVRVRNLSGYFPFEHYVLKRNMMYERSFVSTVEDWRSGMHN